MRDHPFVYHDRNNALDNLTVAQVYEAIKNCFRHALNSDTYAKQTRQDMVMSGADTAAYAHGVPSDVDYREIPALMPLPGSTASGILTYNNTSASGTSATEAGSIIPVSISFTSLGSPTFSKIGLSSLLKPYNFLK